MLEWNLKLAEPHHFRIGIVSPRAFLHALQEAWIKWPRSHGSKVVFSKALSVREFN